MNMHSGLLLHVAADTTNLGIVGPIFQDMSFEFLPIPSDLEKLSYKHYPARNLQYGRNLADFIPSDRAGDPVHCDPEFQRFTYGQPIFYEGEHFTGEIVRTQTLKKLRKGNVLFFFASLAFYNADIYKLKDFSLRSYQVGRKNKYVIGCFTIEGVAEVYVERAREQSQDTINIELLSGKVEKEDVRANAHYQRLETEDANSFLLIKGDESRSFLLTHAVRLTDHFEKTAFKLNELGQSILRKTTDVMRGARWIDKDSTKLLIEKIAESNPEIRSNIPNMR